MFMHTARVGDREITEPTELPTSVNEVIKEILLQNKKILKNNNLLIKILCEEKINNHINGLGSSMGREPRG